MKTRQQTEGHLDLSLMTAPRSTVQEEINKELDMQLSDRSFLSVWWDSIRGVGKGAGRGEVGGGRRKEEDNESIILNKNMLVVFNYCGARIGE